ncbi:transcription elongation factor GreA [bacterium]|nr:transcription elongation factor GreA [bacterium]
MTKSDQIYITKEGLKKLKEELSELIDSKRPEVAKKIQEAREMGDISENSAYDSAKQEQSFMEGRISELEEIIKNAKVTQPKDPKTVDVGCRVVLHIEGDEEEFHIVGAPEANPMERKISHESPLGAALVGKKIGDSVKIEAPVGKLTYTILKVEY